MAKIHITPDGPKRCEADIRVCKYSQNGGEHYDNMDDAQAAYDKQMKEEHGSFAVKNNSKEKLSLKQQMEKELLNGKNDAEIKEKIDKEYEKLKNSDRITQHAYMKNVLNPKKTNESAENFNVSIENDQLKFETIGYSVHIKNTPEWKKNFGAPLKNKDFTKHEQEYEVYDFDDEQNIYYYDIDDYDKEMLENQAKFDTIKEIRKDFNNKDKNTTDPHDLTTNKNNNNRYNHAIDPNNDKKQANTQYKKALKNTKKAPTVKESLKKELLKGNSISEINANINKKYEELKNSDRSTEQAMIKKLTQPRSVNESAEGFHASIENGQLKFESIGLTVNTDSEFKKYFGPPLNNREVASHVRNFGVYDYDDEENVYYYDLDNYEKETLENQEKFNAVREIQREFNNKVKERKNKQ